MSDSEEQLKRMVMTFRVSELQMLLGFAGKNKTGRKNELQTRALDIVRMRNPSIQQKIRELYKSIQLEMMSFGDRSQAAAGGAPAGILPNQRVPSGLNSMTSGYSQTPNVGQNLGVTVSSSGYSSRSSTAQVGQVAAMSANVGYASIQAAHSNYPISPDVRLKKLPFYDILGELLKPSTLAPQGSGRYQEGTFTFSLTPQQANKISHSRDLRPGKQDYSVQVQMRFCLLETTCEQEDNFPPNITVKINDKMCPLPSPIPTNKAGVEPKRPSRPVNVTALCRISPTVTNHILVTWSSDYGRCYVISVYLVQKLTSEDLLQRLKAKGPKLPDFTRSLIKQKLREDGECEIATTSLRCSLLCPLGKMRMVLPCRAETCSHLQCFDASLFLQMNERKPTWSCPVCDKGALYDHLVIDGYFQEVLAQNANCTEVTLQKEGGWMPLMPKKEPKEQQPEKPKSEVAIETLSDDSDDSDHETPKAPENDDSVVEEVRNKRKNPDVEVITLSDSEDESSAPPSKRPAYQSSNATGPAANSPSSATSGVTANGGNTSSSSVTSSTGSNSSSSAPSTGRAETPTPENAVGPNNECTKSNDSWCVGEVDPGKRLIFRKSLSSSSSNSGGLFAPNNGVPNSAASPGSSGSASPQVICLDSPASSPHSPRPAVSQEEQISLSQIAAVVPAPAALPSATPVLAPVPVTTPTASIHSPLTTCSPLSNPASMAASLASLGSELTPINSNCSAIIPLSSPPMPVSITPVQNSPLSPTDNITPPSVSSGNAFNMLQDPLSNASFGLNPLTSSSLNPPYNLPTGLQLFNPMSIMSSVPPTTNANINYRPQDRYM